MLRPASMSLLLTFLWTVPGAEAQASGGGPSRAVLTAIERMKADGFSPTGPSILEMEGLVRSELLSQSGVQILEIKREVPGTTDLLYEFSSVTGQGDLVGVSEHLEVVSLDVDGESMLFTRAVPPEEIERRRLEALGIARERAADALHVYSIGAIILGAKLRDQMPFLKGIAPPEGATGRMTIRDGETAYLVAGTCGASVHLGDEIRSQAVDQSWLSPDPLTFMTGIACFTMFTAEVLRASDLTEAEKRARIAGARQQAAERIRLAGEEVLDGQPTYALAMKDLGLSQTMEDGSRVEFHTASVWIDKQTFVRRKTRFEGVMHAEGKSREFFLERLEQDYRNVPGTILYEPYLSVMRVGGMTTPAQEREMQKALKQLEEFEREMASVPASQRAMVERMMGDKIEQVRALAQGGAVEFRMITTDIRVNPDLAAGALALLDEASLVRLIQQDLAKLGYDPGPVNGELTDRTRAAIAKFQTDTGLEPTGQATVALAAALRAAIASRGE